MMIEDNRSTRAIENIEVGKCFRYEGEIYIKTDVCIGFENKECDCTSLITGESKNFDVRLYVEPVNAKVVIE